MPIPEQLRRYYEKKSVLISKPRTSSRLEKLHRNVQSLRALNEHHFPQNEKQLTEEMAKKEAKNLARKEGKAVQKLVDPMRACDLALTIRSLFHMKEFFSDGLSGGIFTTELEPLQMKKSEEEENEHPLFFIMESLNRVYKDPSLLERLPQPKPDVISKWHHLPATDNIFFDRFVCRKWFDRIDTQLHKLLSPLHKLPSLMERARKIQAWHLLKGDPLQRALRLARMGRLIYLLEEQRLKVNRLSMRRAWEPLHSLFIRYRRIESQILENRRKRMLRNYWKCWQQFIHEHAWVVMEEMRIARGLHVVELLWRRKQYVRAWRAWIHLSANVAQFRLFEWQNRMRNKYFQIWIEWVEEVQHLRSRKAYEMLVSSIRRRNQGVSAHHTALAAEKFCDGMLRRRAWRLWISLVLQRKRLRSMVLAAFERMVGRYVGMAFAMWLRGVKEELRLDLKKQRKIRTLKAREAERCHMCLHLACPSSCRYLAEKRALRRSAWKFIEL